MHTHCFKEIARVFKYIKKVKVATDVRFCSGAKKKRLLWGELFLVGMVSGKDYQYQWVSGWLGGPRTKRL